MDDLLGSIEILDDILKLIRDGEVECTHGQWLFVVGVRHGLMAAAGLVPLTV